MCFSVCLTALPTCRLLPVPACRACLPVPVPVACLPPPALHACVQALTQANSPADPPSALSHAHLSASCHRRPPPRFAPPDLGCPLGSSQASRPSPPRSLSPMSPLTRHAHHAQVLALHPGRRRRVPQHGPVLQCLPLHPPARRASGAGCGWGRLEERGAGERSLPKRGQLLLAAAAPHPAGRASGCPPASAAAAAL